VLRRLTGGRLSPLVVVLAVLLALALGAGHAALPGHGKTVLAAYLAGRAGRPRDAVAVGVLVTLTHTAGVLVAGVLLTVFTALAGERLLTYLGIVSGLLVVDGRRRDGAQPAAAPARTPARPSTLARPPAPA
jgi:ABC-type nickel/cobalt efflux system permease component RcnA